MGEGDAVPHGQAVFIRQLFGEQHREGVLRLDVAALQQGVFLLPEHVQQLGIPHGCDLPHVAGGIVAGTRQKMQLLAFGVAVLLGVVEFWFRWSSFVPKLAAKKSEPQKRDSRTKQASLRWARLTVWTPAASASEKAKEKAELWDAACVQAPLI